jgi:hypothetical protein
VPRHPPNALKSLDALITNVHPCLVVSLTLTSGVSDLGRSDERTLDLRKTYMCSICLPQSGQAPASHVSQQQDDLSIITLLSLRAMQANPFIHDVNQQDASLIQDGETGHTRSQRPNAGTTTLYWNGGARRDRTDDLKLAKLPLSQLSYGPVSPTLPEAGSSRPSLNLVGLGRLELPTSRLSSARSNQLSYKPGTRE